MKMSNHLPETNDFSIASKLSMVTKGYFQDDCIKYLSPKFKRRSPLINIGYYVRAVVVNEGINFFLKNVQHVESQIVSLGAGFDTTYFRLISSNDKVYYFEMDFKEVVKNKLNQIKNTEFLFNQLIEPEECMQGLLSKHYCLIAQDMSDIQGLKKTLLDAGLKPERPTLFLSECAITYMEEVTSRKIIEWGSSFKDVIFLIYEQINPNDGFGQVMTNHFDLIESPLKSLEKYHSKSDQVNRFKTCGYESAWSIGAFEIYKKVLPPSEHERVLNLEPFDEWEEWHLTSSHYSLSSGINGIFQTPSMEFLSTFKTNLTSQSPRATCDWLLETDVNLQFFGHCALLIWNSSACLVIGGFGLDRDDKHKRLSHLCLVTLQDMKVKYISPPCIEGVSWDCMYHTCTLISDDIQKSEILLYGGRTSPLRAVNCTPCIVTVAKNNLNEVVISGRTLLIAGSQFPQGRRRHSATRIGGGTFIFGGLHTDIEQSKQKILGDAWVLAEDKVWRIEDCKPPPRFSHSASSCNGIIYIVGGIGPSFEPLSDVWTYHFSEKVWNQIVLTIIPRYSHTSHIVNDTLLLIGGVNDLSENQPRVTTIKLCDMSVAEYNLPESSRKLPIMLHNHSSFIYTDSVYIFGGGGNCFSFGTSFNKHPVRLKLDSLIP